MAIVRHRAMAVAFHAGLALGITIASGTSADARLLTTVYSFCGEAVHCKDGSAPVGLSADQSGNLYGVASELGGKGANGTVYELIGGKKFRILHQFCLHHDCSDGAEPLGAPIIDVNGNVYGTTAQGGAHHNFGVVFEIEADGTYHKLYEFCPQGGSCADGSNPWGGLTYVGAESGTPYDGVSPLYGLTVLGGSQDSGVAYQLTRNGDTWSQTVLYNFCSQGGESCTDGLDPNGTLLPDASGDLFGTTSMGGANRTGDFPLGAGTVFKLSANGDSWTETVLYNFCGRPGCSDGAFPYYGSLVSDSSGALYGATLNGGHSCTPAGTKQTCGVVFSLAPDGDTWKETVLHAFCKKADCPDGTGGVGPLVLDAEGTLFGVASAGGGNDIDQDHAGGGVLFELKGTQYKVLHSFCALASCADGEYPYSGVILGNGTLYGATVLGGANRAGTVFKLKP